MKVSNIGFGAAALGGVYGEVSEGQGEEVVRCAIEKGINYFDTSPYYGLTKSETRLGEILKGYPREKYYLSTKTGRSGDKAQDFGYDESCIRRMVEESLNRLKVNYVDILFLHDIEYCGGRLVEEALGEGLDTLQNLKQQGLVRYIGVGTYPVDLIKRMINEQIVDVILCHNHYHLFDQQFLDIKTLADQKNVALVNASPLATGVLTQIGPRDWHPATKDERKLLSEVIEFCNHQGWPIEKLGIQYVLSGNMADTTLISLSSVEQLQQILSWEAEDGNKELTQQVQEMLRPLYNRDWNFDVLS